MCHFWATLGEKAGPGRGTRAGAAFAGFPRNPHIATARTALGLNGPIGIAFSPSRSGDCTIHGAPWRSQFGFPQSNGCVSLDSRVAKQVYDWTPIGTPVNIHY